MDDAEFETLYRASVRRLVGVTYAVCGDQAEAQDCVQEAFVRAWVRRRQLERDGTPEAWVRLTAMRLAVSGWRHRRRGRQAATLAAGTAPAVQAGPSGTRADVVRALAGLPAPMRMVLALHYLCDQPVAQIALELRMPENTVKSHLSRGRGALRDTLAAYSPDLAHEGERDA